MTNAEAIKVLESLCPHGSDEYGWIECGNAIVLAIEALEKQIAINPYRIHANIFHCGNDNNCDAFFTESDEYRYCPFCGQKILWE